MKLCELEPRWVHPNIFVFLCPHCRKILLSCKNAAMKHQQQREVFEKEFGDGWGLMVVWSKPEQAWAITGSLLADLTVTPSIDASASGHWHGWITNGECSP